MVLGRIRAAWLVLLIMPLAVAPARAQNAGRAAMVTADLFSVVGVPIDATGESAVAARPAALAEGQRRALRTLLQRLTLRADHSRLPAPNDPAINGLVRGIELADERTSATRYIAKLTVRFHPDGIRDLLRTAGIPYTETPARPALVLPVFQHELRVVLWDEPNPWRDAWVARARIEGLRPLLAPVGDLADLTAVSAEEAVAGNEAALNRIAERYGVVEVIVAHAKPISNGRLEVTLQRYGPGGIHVRVEEVATDSESATPLRSAVREIEARLEDQWKRDNLLRLDSAASLSATVPLSALGDWVAVRDRLGQVTVVRKVDLASLTRDDAQIVVHYFGSPQQLAVALAQRDLELSQAGGFWTLRLAGNRPLQ